MSVDLSILGKLWEEDPGASSGEPVREEAEPAAAPRNLYSLSDEQEAYIARTKAEIIEQVLTGDNTASLFLKALGVMCVCVNDKAYYDTVARLVRNVWGEGLGRLRTLAEIPQEFVLSELQKNIEDLERNGREKKLDAQAKEDIKNAREKMQTKGEGIFEKLPETSKAAYLSFEGKDALKRP